jgi:hypothetical protein
MITDRGDEYQLVANGFPDRWSREAMRLPVLTHIPFPQLGRQLPEELKEHSEPGLNFANNPGVLVGRGAGEVHTHEQQ